MKLSKLKYNDLKDFRLGARFWKQKIKRQSKSTKYRQIKIPFLLPSGVKQN